MKILWFTSTLMPELTQTLGRKSGVSGGWISSLLDELRCVEDIQIAVASIYPEVEKLTKYEINGVTYFLLPRNLISQPLLEKIFIDNCLEVLRVFNPDVIHVHGTEDVYGLFTSYKTLLYPVVISIQGLLHVHYQHVKGGLTLRNSLDGGKEGVLSWFRFLLLEFQWKKRGNIEKIIISGNHHFIGRTMWDKAHVLAVNPKCNYYHGGEMLRPEFFSRQWKITQASRHTIFCTAAYSPLKGFHWLLYAIVLLRQNFPTINVRVAGALWNESKGFGYYGRYIKRLIDKYDLSLNITPLPELTSEEVAREMSMAHLFVIPSLIENSPNSLAEAMLVGTPCVTSFVGGIPSMIDDDGTALCFPSGDPAYLAHCISRIFSNDDLAVSISSRARRVALDRHNPEKIVTHQLDIYRQVISKKIIKCTL